MDWKLEVVILPVADVDRAKTFYAGTLGWTLDVDHAPNDDFRVVQLTPPGSACSVTFGVGLGTADVAPGTYQGMHLVVEDVAAAHADLVRRGVECGEPFHYGAHGKAPGVDAEHRDFASYVTFSDPDGNGWVVQERGHPESRGTAQPPE
ncbi:MAG TPA: VOC family protein [Candidatus Angelobacter sp.]|nr:VOC family protein [Candidatus Angelobacter sp.]